MGSGSDSGSISDSGPGPDSSPGPDPGPGPGVECCSGMMLKIELIWEWEVSSELGLGVVMLRGNL